MWPPWVNYPPVGGLPLRRAATARFFHSFMAPACAIPSTLNSHSPSEHHSDGEQVEVAVQILGQAGTDTMFLLVTHPAQNRRTGGAELEAPTVANNCSDSRSLPPWCV